MAEAPQSVLKLVERFELHRDAYRRGRYGEAEVRVELIEDLYFGICPQNPQEERQLLRDTHPMRDLIDVLEARLLGLDGCLEHVRDGHQ